MAPPSNPRHSADYDVVVVGAGHAGCEAALAAARIGCRTLLVTSNLDTVALMPCNPSIGGPAKGHLVREIDALGGEMGRNTDRTFLQMRLLNSSKGPAVQAFRAQSDKRAYGAAMRRTLETQPNLTLKQALVHSVAFEDEAGAAPGQARKVARGIVTSSGALYTGRAVVITTGTFLNGRIVMGNHVEPAGRAGEFPALKLSGSLQGLGLRVGRLKTGTPPRVDARTIDFSLATLQPGGDRPLYFSHWARRWIEAHSRGLPPPAATSLAPDFVDEPRPADWRRQLPCHLVHTTPATHAIIRANLDRAPLFSGVIEGVGPRYCPSIEDKIVRFAHKESHQLFLEPEGWHTHEVYVQGANTSLPEDVQVAMIHSIPALRQAEIMRAGYAVEYDFVPPDQVHASLEVRAVRGLFLAGQINGTTGYEEAAAQGLLAGINAACHVRGREPLVLRRDQAYVGVMIDDLVTQEITEPYRQMTSRAEYRLLLRQDNADLRLTPLGHAVGLVDDERLAWVERKREHIARALAGLERARVPAGARSARALLDLGSTPLTQNAPALEVLKRPAVSYHLVAALAGLPDGVEPEVAEQVELEVKYAGYLRKQEQQVARAARAERQPIPEGFDYTRVPGLRNEAREKLLRFRPATLGQASRIYGVNPADLAVLSVWLHRLSAPPVPVA